MERKYPGDKYILGGSVLRKILRTRNNRNGKIRFERREIFRG